VIGCNAAGVDDGTYYTVDGNNAIANCIKGSRKYVFWKNIRLINATSYGFLANGSTFFLWYHCEASNNGRDGWNNCTYMAWVHCVADNNTRYGIYGLTYTSCVFCNVVGNGRDGILAEAVVGCVAHNNTFGGVRTATGTSVCMSNVCDGNSTSGIILTSAAKLALLIGNRLTHNGGYAVENTGTDNLWFDDVNFAYNNTTGAKETEPAFAGNNSDWAGSADGYVDRANDNFNLTNTAELRRVGIVVGDG
jgi:hypothetical protein